MAIETGSSSGAKHNDITDNVFFSVVRSLYSDPKTLLVGVWSVFVAALLAYYKTTEVFHLYFAILFIVGGFVRVFLARLFDKAICQPISRRQYEIWEKYYAIAGSLYVGLICSWFICCIYLSDDKFVHMMALTLTLCFLVGIIGRNFASKVVVDLQVYTSAFMITLGLAVHGDVYYLILSLFLLPFLLANKFIAKRLRNMLFRAEREADDHRIVANRFDVALNSITHGVAMFSPKGDITVANEKFTNLSGTSSTNLIGENISSLDKKIRLSDSKATTLGQELSDYLDYGEARKLTFQIDSAKTIEAFFNPMHSGGVVLLSDISDRVASENAIKKLASFDPLTNLPNRRHFISEIDKILSKNNQLQPCAMFFVDLDKFKVVNDTLGHAIGDKLLRKFAESLEAMLPENAIVCRFGGDEFVVAIPEMQDNAECSALAETIINEAAQPIVIDGNTIKVGATIGIAIAPKDGKSADQLLQYTDSALYDAKARGRSTYTFYSEKLGEAIQFRRQLEMDMRTALKNKEFKVHYQPLVNLEYGKITTCEALLRWHHPQYGNISPSVFVHIAEETGLITQIGEYVLQQAARDCLTWPSDTRVAVNVSSIQFCKTDIVRVVSDVLQTTGLPANRLEVEITETAMLEDLDETTHTLQALSDIGVRISLDDFGTGFSSLSYLHTLPFDKVKIDRSFLENGLSDTRTLTLLKGVVELINNLGLNVVVEGIECEDQINMLVKNMKVDEFQGFLFAKPMPLNDIYQLLDVFEKPGVHDNCEVSKIHA